MKDLPGQIPDPSEKGSLSLLETGEIEVKGQFVLGSNYSFLANIQQGGLNIKAIYKPIRGGYPLWDFNFESLPHRETAAYMVSREIGWKFVPATTVRENAPFGPGSLQIFIDHDPQKTYFSLDKKHQPTLKKIVLFDMLINNADRKGSHILEDEKGKLWLIDHGLCFHTEPKLRSVIWEFSGMQIPVEYISDLARFNECLAADHPFRKDLQNHLQPLEVDVLRERIEKISAEPTFPHPDEERRSYPWPLV